MLLIELNLIQLVTWGVTNRDVLLLATIRYVVLCPIRTKNLERSLSPTGFFSLRVNYRQFSQKMQQPPVNQN